MTTFFGIACLVFGVMWLFIPMLSNNSISGSLIKNSDSRNQLFDSYLLLHDHLEKVGTPEQKAALQSILPAIANKPQGA